jgi:hypothetical protein
VLTVKPVNHKGRHKKMAYNDLKDILSRSTLWEQELKDLMDVTVLALRDEQCKKILQFLTDDLDKNLAVIKKINPGEFNGAEWIKFPDRYQTEDLVPKKALSRDATKEEIFKLILEYEEKLRDFYDSIQHTAAYAGHKDLFHSLYQFKIRQIIEIKKFIRDCNLSF